MPIRALVLAGGGVRGAFQVGMVRELVKTLDFHVIRGVSVGAINGAFLAQAPAQPDSESHGAMQRQALALEKVWKGLGDAMRTVAQSQGSRIDRMQAFGAALKELISTTIGGERLRNSGRDFAAGYVSLLSGRYDEAKSDEPDIVEFVHASAALPPYFPFVDRPADLIVDGGFRNITPLGSALKAQNAPDEVYVLLTRGISGEGGRLLDSTIEEQPLAPWKELTSDQQKLYEHVTERLVEILMDEVYIEDIKRAIQVNTFARAIDDRGLDEDAAKVALTPAYKISGRPRSLRYVKLYVLAPRRRFNPGAAPGHGDDIDNFDTDLILKAMDHGAEVAKDPSQWTWRPELETKMDVAPQ
jgi:NTE family protein